MSETSANLINALLITLIGMGLVFSVIFLLWGVMDIAVRFGAWSETRRSKITVIVNQLDQKVDDKYKAAIAAVAYALTMQADRNQPHEFPLPPTALVSAWQAVLRSRILHNRGRIK